MRKYGLKNIQAIFPWPFHSSVSQYTTLEVQYKLFAEEYKVAMASIRFPGRGRRRGYPVPTPSPNFIRRYFHLKEVLGHKVRKYHTWRPKRNKHYFSIRLFQRCNRTRNLYPLKSKYKKNIYLIFNFSLSIDHSLKIHFLHLGFKL